MSNFVVDSGANNGEIADTLNYLLSNLGNAPGGLIVNRQTGEIYNQGTNTITGYLYRYINIAWANNIQGLYFSSAAANQTFYGISNSNNPTYPVGNTSFVWFTVYDGVAGHPQAIGPSNGVYLWYSVGGGRTVTFVFSTTSPGTGFLQFADGVAIDLDQITAVGNAAIIGNNTVIGDYLTVGDYWNLGSFGNIAAPVTIANLATNSVLNTNTVGTTQLQDFSVTNIKLGNSSVTSGKIANFTIIDQDIANLTITGSKIVDYTLVGTKLANATVTTQQVADYTLEGTNLANLTITGQQVADYTLVGTKLANLTVTGAQVADYTLVGTKLANLTVTSGQLANGAVTSGKIANYTIQAIDIANAAITTQQVSSYTLLGTNLANATITSQQVQDYSLTGTDMANLTVTGQQIANSTIDQTKLNIATLSSITANAGNITSGQISGAAIGGATTISGYTAGAAPGFGNVSTPNFTSTALTTYTVSTPAATRVFISITGSVNNWDTQANLTYYNALRGNVVVDLLYSNSTVRSSFTTFTTAQATFQRVTGTQFNYRFFIPYAMDTSLLLVPDTYTIQITPNLVFVDNTTGNTVVAIGQTPSTSAQTFQGRAAFFQANIS